MKKIAKVFALMFILTGPTWAAVNINTATQSELESVKGLGAAKAKAIIVYREKNGPFKSVDELDKVKGFGKATVDKLRPELSTESTPNLAAEKPTASAAK